VSSTRLTSSALPATARPPTHPHPALVALERQASAIVRTHPAPSVMWFTDRALRVTSQHGPLAPFFAAAPGTLVAEWAAAHLSAEMQAVVVGAHERAVATRQPQRFHLAANGRRIRCLLRPMSETEPNGDRYVFGLQGSAALLPPTEDEVRAVLEGIARGGAGGRRLVLVALVDLYEYGLQEGEELVVVGSFEELARMRYVAPADLAALLQEGLLVPTEAVSLPQPAAAAALAPPAAWKPAPARRARGTDPPPRAGYLRLLPRWSAGPAAVPSGPSEPVPA
jgi:hypothetical protein